MKNLLRLKRFINKGIFVIGVISCYLQLKEHSFFLVLNNTGKLKYQENACKDLVPMKSQSPLYVVLPCHSNLRSPSLKNEESSSMCDDLGLVTVNNELLLCYLRFAEVTLAWASITGTWLTLLFMVWQECASAPENFKLGWFAGSPERIWVHGTAYMDLSLLGW